jgi:GT2 family glycosyltransferase
MDVSIIIVNYNTKALLKQCLISVFEKTQDIHFEVIVVDNASHDGSPQMMQEEFPKVTFIESPENLGFGRANNLGAQYAKGKYLFLLNSDTIVLNNAVKILATFLDNNPKVGICGGNLFDADKNPAISYDMLLPSILQEVNIFFAGILGKLRYGKNIRFNHTQQPKKVGYISGADFMIRHDLFRHLDGFDPDFFMYYEETELTFRVKIVGYAVYSVPHAEIIHLGEQSSGNWERRTKLFLDSRTKYYRKTQTRFVSWICDSIFILASSLRYCLFIIMNKPEKSKKHLRFIINHTKKTQNE